MFGFDDTVYIGVYRGFYGDDIMILEDKKVQKDVAYLLDLSTIYTPVGHISIGSAVPNFVIIKGGK